MWGYRVLIWGKYTEFRLPSLLPGVAALGTRGDLWTPRYDLTLLAGLAKVPRELRSLLATRQVGTSILILLLLPPPPSSLLLTPSPQRAKLRGEAEGGREAYTEIWANLWHQVGGWVSDM